MAVPDDVETVKDVGQPSFKVVTYGEARASLIFPNGRGPDLVHAFTPRERVRALATEVVTRTRCPFVVHLEDNDRAVLSAELSARIEDLDQLPAAILDRLIGAGQLHPLRGAHFIKQAAGVSVVIDALLDFVPRGVPAEVVKPGFDETVLFPERSRDEVRIELGLRPEDCAVVYTGTIHSANLADMRRLYVAIAALRRDGHPIVFVKTGWNAPNTPELRQLGHGLRNLGRVPRAFLPGLLAAADVLVQPDTPGPFNDYRFPAKLPDFLASGKPVILGRTNIGLALEDGREALVLEEASATELYRAIALLRENPTLARRIGKSGREFALRELRWSASADSVQKLYLDLPLERRRVRRSIELDPPVKLVSLVSERPEDADARTARAHGIHAFCFPLEHPGTIAAPLPDFPFCFRVCSDISIGVVELEQLSDPAYLKVGNAPFLLVDDPGTAGQLRSRAEERAGRAVHLALLERSAARRDTGKDRFDAVVEMPAAPSSGDPADAAMRAHMALSLPQATWFRSIAFPARRESRTVYEVWLRRLVLQTLARAAEQEPLVFVEPRGALSDTQSRNAWLKATRSGLRDGIQQFYASRGLDVDARQVDASLRLE
jgi:glycosyltransferase involved in cell wall biosynthesis